MSHPLGKTYIQKINFLAISEMWVNANRRRLKCEDEGNASSYGNMKHLKYLAHRQRYCSYNNCLLLPFLPYQCSVTSAVLHAGFHVQLLSKVSELVPVCCSCFSALQLSECAAELLPALHFSWASGVHLADLLQPQIASCLPENGQNYT